MPFSSSTIQTSCRRCSVSPHDRSAGRMAVFAPLRCNSALQVVRRLYNRGVVLFAWAVLVIAVVHPANGVGSSPCLLFRTTGVQCPGCGLTRSISCAIRAMPEQSAGYHLFGLPLVGFCGGVAALSLAPRRIRRSVLRRAMRRASTLHIVYMAFISLFVIHGVVRAALTWPFASSASAAM